MSAMDAAAAAELVKEMRKTFNSGRTRPRSWRESQLRNIIRMTEERESDILAALAKDVGKPRTEAFTSDVNPAAAAAQYALAHLKRWMQPHRVSTNLVNLPGSSEIVYEPYGVVLSLSPWNYPYSLALEPAIGAIAAGNAVVLKPSETAPATAALLKELVEASRHPLGVGGVVGGVGESTALLEQRWDKIVYTGSTRVGKVVAMAAAKHLTPVLLELGGKNPAIVTTTANLRVTAQRLAWGRFLNGGQTCTSPDYVLVEESSAGRLVEELKRVVAEWYGESTTQPLSRIISAAHFHRLRAYLQHPGTAERVVAGGQMEESRLFIAPTLLRDVPWDAPVMQEEVFGPILTIQSVRDVEEAIGIVNSRPKPLALYAFSSDRAVQKKIVAETSSGGVCINDTVMHMTNPELPFGGVGDSGVGGHHGHHSFLAFSHPKAVMRKGYVGDLPVRWPPESRYKDLFLRALLKGEYWNLLLVLMGIRK